MKILIEAKGKIKKINSSDFIKIKELSEYLSEKYDLKVEIKNFKVDCKNES
jgi:hypothetical protein